jgi:perosamine synthetase
VRRKLSLLNGTTNAADCAVALAYLVTGFRLVNGGAIARYEEEFARQIGVGHGIALATGRLGLYGLLVTLGVQPGEEVLLQAPTHIVVSNAIRHAGATPVFVDCARGTWNIDLEDAERRVGPRTRVLVLQHTFGAPADLDAVGDFADRHDLVLVEDCVHALGATWRGQPLGSFGRAAFFSTEETKIISTTMGGMVVTDDPALAARMREFQSRCEPPPASLVARYLLKLIAYHLLTQPHVHRFARAMYEAAGQRQPLPKPTEPIELFGGVRASYRQRLGNAQAAIGLRQLARLDENVAHRRRIAAHYREALARRGFETPDWPSGAEPAPVRYPVAVADRDAAERAVAPHAVLGTWFTSVLEEARSPADGGYRTGSCPQAEWAADHLVNLPTHPRVRLDDAERLVAALPQPGMSHAVAAGPAVATAGE